MQKRIHEKRQKAIEDKVAKGKVEDGELDTIVEETAAFKEIFHLCVQGYGVSQITTAITSRHIMNPTTHTKANGINPPDNRKDVGEYYWGSSTISHILTQQEYLGHTVNFKTYRKKGKHICTSR